MKKDKANNKLVPPKSDRSDLGYSVIRAGLSLIPIAGGGLVELLQFVLQPPLEKRRDVWMKEVGEAISDLHEKQGIKFDDLQNNDVFIDTVIHASHIAYRNSQGEKRQALKNAIINSGLPNPIDQSLQQMFLNWLDVFTVWHLRLLHLYQNPEKWEKENDRHFERPPAGGATHILESAYPELKDRRELYDQIWKDLYQKGLVTNDSLHGMITGQGIFSKRTTDLGDLFIGFIII
jgi:hypothetical protein